ncbi:MAG: energy transducer TonB [Desulfobaccales bacterium]
MGEVFRHGTASATRTVWLWALLGSLAVHAAFLTMALSWKVSPPVNKIRVVPVEAVTLTKLTPKPAGGGGTPAEPAPKPLQEAKPQPKPQPKPKPKEVAKKPEKIEAPEPPPTLALPRPAPPAPPVAASRPTPGLSQGTGSGSGQGGSGGGRGGGKGPGMGSGEGPGQGTGTLLQGYLREIRRLLERQKEYPRMAQHMNMQGVAVLQFTIAADGRILGTSLARSSGHGILDNAAQETVKRVGRFPPFPAGLGRESLRIEIPLAFRLTQE